jgi:hypothetical protein
MDPLELLVDEGVVLAPVVSTAPEEVGVVGLGTVTVLVEPPQPAKSAAVAIAEITPLVVMSPSRAPAK